MKNKLPKYDNYKPSNVEWLGEIPQHWEVIPLNGFTKLVSKTGKPQYQLLSVYLEKGVIRFSDVSDKRTNATSEDLTKYQIVEEGNLVLNNQQAWRGSVGVSKFTGIVSPAYLVLEFSKLVDSVFVNYLFRDTSVINYYVIFSRGVGTIQRNLYWQHLKNVKIWLPPLSEQEKIAQFLDEKTTKIDQAIEIKQRQIELLKERRQILIHRAVTRGVGSLSGVETPLKDSGVEWIGEIPEHWEVKRLRYIGKCQNGVSKGAEYFGTGFPFVSYGDVYKSIELAESVNGLAESSIEDRKQYSVKEGDVFFTRTSETVEEIGFASTCLKTIEDATFAGFLIRFRPSKDILYKGFSKFYFSSKTHRAFFVKEMNLVIRASLSQELLNRMPIIIPPFEEQIAIAEYLENISAKISKAIGLKEREIEVLKEYKSSLINSALTGKVKIG